MFPACLFSAKPLHSCKHFHRWGQGASKCRQVGCPHFIMNLFIYFYSFINFLFKTGSHGSERLSTQVPSTKWGKPRMTRGSGLVDVSVTVPWIFTLTTHSSPLADPLRVSVSLPGRLLYNTIQTKRFKAPKKSNKKVELASHQARRSSRLLHPLLRTCWFFWNRPEGRHLLRNSSGSPLCHSVLFLLHKATAVAFQMFLIKRGTGVKDRSALPSGPARQMERFRNSFDFSRLDPKKVQRGHPVFPNVWQKVTLNLIQNTSSIPEGRTFLLHVPFVSLHEER